MLDLWIDHGYFGRLLGRPDSEEGRSETCACRGRYGRTNLSLGCVYPEGNNQASLAYACDLCYSTQGSSSLVSSISLNPDHPVHLVGRILEESWTGIETPKRRNGAWMLTCGPRGVGTSCVHLAIVRTGG